MTSRTDQIAPPRRRQGRSMFTRAVTPLTVTVVAALNLLLPLIDTTPTSILFLLTRPLTVALVIIGVGVIVSLVTMLAGVLVGLRIRFVAVGPFRIQASGSGWITGLNDSWRSFVGSVLVAPPQGSFNRSQAVAVAGTGVLVSLLLAAFSILYARSHDWPGIDDPAVGDVTEALLLSLPVGAVIVLAAELLTGGTVLSTALRASESEQRRFLANMTIASHMATGRRPREWEAGLIRQATSVPDTSADHLLGLGFAYLHAVDTGDYTAANRHLNSFEQWLQESSSSVRPYVISSLSGYVSLYHERAWLIAVHSRDLDGASEYLNRAAGFDVAYPIEMRVKAEILDLEGDHQAAISFAQAARESLDQFPVTEQWRVPFEGDLLNRILERENTPQR